MDIKKEKTIDSETVVITMPKSAGTCSPSTSTTSPHNYTNTITGGNITYTIGTTTQPTWSTATSGKMNLIGEDADLVVNGVSVMKLLQEQLPMMVPNPQIEKEWHELKELGDKYRELEADIKEKLKILDILKRD